LTTDLTALALTITATLPAASLTVEVSITPGDGFVSVSTPMTAAASVIFWPPE
jgi:hypothetical protein